MELVILGDNDLPTFNPAVKEIREFKALIHRDKGTKDTEIGGDHDGRKKLISTKELALIYFYCGSNSMYEAFEGKEKIDKIKTDLELPSKWKVDDEIQAAIDKYNELTYTPSRKLIETARKSIDQLITFLDDVDLGERTKTGGMVFSPKNLQDSIKDIPNTIKSLNEAEKILRQEMENLAGKRMDTLSLTEKEVAKVEGKY